MSSSIPEIRIYSPSDKGCNNNDSIFGHLRIVNGDVSAQSQKLTLDDPRTFLMSGKDFFRMKAESLYSQDVKSGSGMVKWENTFHMRLCNLSKFPSNGNGCRTNSRSQAIAMQRSKLGCITGSAKSLDILRQNLQKTINKEIDVIIQKYIETFFRPGFDNIKLNNGESSVSEQHLQTVCRQILEEAKKMYQTNYTRGGSPGVDYLEMENGVHSKIVRALHKGSSKRCKDSDTDSETSQITLKPKKKKGRPPLSYPGSLSGRSTPSKLKTGDQIKREGPKWDPARITSETCFIMGAKANKALGLGATRGRLYIKHPEIFKYSGDQEDKQWLYEHNLMPATGGKAYMLLIEDIQELAQSEEYRNNPALSVNDIVGFTIPNSMIEKMKTFMQSMRTDVLVRKRGRPPTSVDSSASDFCIYSSIKLEDSGNEEKRQEVESEAPTPTDDLDLLSAEMQSTDPSPFSLGPAFEDVSPAQPDVSPSPSDLSATLDPPLSAPFDISSPP